MSVSEEIKDRLDIVDIISSRVALKKTGRNFVGFCPFHSNTRTPAFTVFPATQSYYCFGCGQSGDAFTFLMKLDNLEFKDVLSQLAQKTGVALVSRPESRSAEESHLARLREINLAAAQFYHNLLLKSDEAKATRDYLAQRGVNASSITLFQLGFAPDRWDDLCKYLRSKEVSFGELEAAGLGIQGDDGRFHDRFRHRLIFPIRDRRGQVIGFGGRALGDHPAKYLNSPQTELFDKSSTLYAVDLATKGIESSGEAVIVEGYMDAVVAHQHGLSNVVASMGTALNERHFALLRKMTRGIVLALDADEAGDVAAVRGWEVMRQSVQRLRVPVSGSHGLIGFERKMDTSVKIAALPRGKDPDEVIHESPEEWRRIIAAAQPIVDYCFDTVTSKLDLRLARDKSVAVKELAPVIRDVGDPVERAHYIQRLAALVRVEEKVVQAAVLRVKSTRGESRLSPESSAPSRERSFEDHLLALYLRYPYVIVNTSAALLDDFVEAKNRLIYSALRQVAEEQNKADLENLRVGLDGDLADHLDYLVREGVAEPELADYEVEEEAVSRLNRVRRHRLGQLIQQHEFLLREAEETGDTETVKELRMNNVPHLAVQLGSYRPKRSPYFRDSRDT